MCVTDISGKKLVGSARRRRTLLQRLAQMSWVRMMRTVLLLGQKTVAPRSALVSPEGEVTVNMV